MSPPPSEWALELANEIVPEGEDLAAMWEAVRVDVARALDAARCEGIEAAAKVCDERATTREAAAEEMHKAREYKDATTYRTYAAAERALAGTIRALAPETPV